VADKVKDFATLSDDVSSPGSKAGFEIDISAGGVHYGFKSRVPDNILSTVENPAEFGAVAPVIVGKVESQEIRE
jgi:hypothetical protein